MFKLLLSVLSLSLLSVSALANVGSYRLGDVWGKEKVTSKVLESETDVFVRAAKATAKLPIGGTGFYIGKFNGVHILATNYHVCPKEKDCYKDRAKFTMLDKSFPITKLYISIPEIDLALLALDVKPEDEALLMSVGQNFAFDKSITKGMELLTIGFGKGGNSAGRMMAGQDNDCKVFSDTDEFRNLMDPDKMSPGRYSAWSFAHGCDISHGDSGSAMVDRNTGEVIGIAWTGRLPKSKIVQKSSSLDEIFNSSSSLIWEELSFSVPAAKIKEYLYEISINPNTDVETQEVLKAIIE